MRIFISQPMRDKTDEEIKAERNHIIDNIKSKYGKDVEIIDTFLEGVPHEAKPLYYLGESFKLLSTADLAVFAYGWQKARGCRMERLACIEYGIEYVIGLYPKN